MSLQALPGGQLQITFVFDLLDTSHNVIGRLSPFSDSPPSINNNINRTVKRQLSGLELPVADTASINTLTDRVRPRAIFHDGTAIVQRHCGIFLFSDVTRARRTYGSTQLATTGSQLSTVGSMLDQLSTIDQPTETSISFRPSTPISSALETLMERSTAISWHIDSSTAKIRGSEWFVKPAGTSLLEVINELAQLGGYYTLFFDNEGVGQLKQVPDLASSEVEFAYGEGSTVFANSITESDDLLSAPNRYIVINNSLTDEPVQGHWDIPTTSPNSISNRGFVVGKVVDMQGVESNAEAEAAAKAFGQADYSTYSWATFDTVINPDHDTFNIVAWRGVKYREQSWSYECSHDGVQRHELRRIYAEELSI